MYLYSFPPCPCNKKSIVPVWLVLELFASSCFGQWDVSKRHAAITETVSMQLELSSWAFSPNSPKCWFTEPRRKMRHVMNRTHSSFQTCHRQLMADPTHELITLSHHYPLEAHLHSNGIQKNVESRSDGNKR